MPPNASASGQALSRSGARPSDAASVRDIVRDAIDRQTRLRIVGRGTWLDAGRPVDDAHPIALDALTGITVVLSALASLLWWIIARVLYALARRVLRLSPG